MAIPRVKRAIRWAALCGVMLVLFAGQALALGLGRIDVKSRAGEPLLAEIPVVSSDPAELDALRARLASPDTFRRIGLPAPDAVLTGLEFAVALDARGRPVIRVTTREPVTQPVLTFLVEVDWGQGRLVREYSALIDAPQTVSAPAQPAIQAPAAAPSNTIVRTPVAEAPVEDAPVASDDDARGAAEADEARERPAEAADRAGTGSEPAPVARTPAPAPATPPATPPAGPAAGPEAPTAAPTGEYGPVRAGETLGEIAQRLAGDGIRREQAIVALFRANPSAFIANNLNLVREGAVLRIPDRDEIAGLGLAESRALMREQIAAWREMTGAAPQPGQAVAGEGGATSPAGQDTTAAAPAAPAANGPRPADARLEIVPPSASGAQQAGIRSGIQAGGEGEMLRQELQQELVESRETLAARNAEVEELKARVADLERLQAQQAQLIEMKDSELAAAQERLATTGAAEPAATGDAANLPWPWIGLALVVVALVAWLLARRSPKATPRPRFGSGPVMPVATAPGEDDRAVAGEVEVDAGAEGASGAAAAAGTAAAVPAPAWGNAVGKAPSAAAVPAWAESAGRRHGGSYTEDAQVPEGVIAADSPAGALEAGNERIELARAYLDLGDTDTARELLREVAEDGDADSRAEATRLLAGIA